MNERAIRLIFVVASLLAAPAVLAQRRTVDIAFSIKPGHLYDNFDAAHMQLIQNTVRAGIATKLSGPQGSITEHGAFPLFDFWAQPGDNHLTIEVDDDPTAEGIDPPVILRLRMNADVRPDDDPLIVVFRGDGRNEPAGSASTFAADIVKKLADDLDAPPRAAAEGRPATGRQHWVDTLFHEVVVAADATPRLFEKAFLLPFSAAQYEIGERSRFRITTGSDEFHAKTRTSGAQLTAFVDDPPEVAKLVQGRGLRPNKVHFLQYDRVKPPAAATPPSAANLGRGGQ